MADEEKNLPEQPEQPEETEQKDNNEEEGGGQGVAIGMCLGLSLGLMIGLLREDLLIWTTMGLALGLCFGSAIDNFKAKKKEPADKVSEQEKPEDTEKTEE